MSVFSRLTEIINANLNALLDEAEDPEKMLQLITREMEETLVEVRSGTARHIALGKSIQSRIQQCRKEASCWQERAEMAVGKGRDELARAALVERQRLLDHLVLLERESVENDLQLQRLQADTDQLQAKLREARVRQRTLLARHETVSSRLRIRRQLHQDQIEGALSRFDEYERRLDDLEGQVESFDLGQRTLHREISELEDEGVIERELAALKAGVAQRRGQPGNG